ncbi:MAG: dTDP-4-dehydrorhamnose reductase [Acidimicrobiales bacterium]
MRRVLITGAGGALGQDLASAFAANDWGVTPLGHADLDVSDRDTVLAACSGIRPDLVVHAGAWTAVDDCESDPDRAFAVNALGTRHVAEGSAATGAHLVYISTDYVFDGASSLPYNEWDRTNPLSVYGRSKLAGEKEAGAGATVIRTSWVCGRHGTGMVHTALRLLAGEGPLRFVDDQVGCPTFTADLAHMVESLATERRPGLFHVTNSGPTTWYGFVRAVAEAAGADPNRVEPISTGELTPPRPAPRPANSVLDNAALRLSGVSLLGHWSAPLADVVRELTGN